MTADEARKLTTKNRTHLSLCMMNIKAKASQGYSSCSVYFGRIDKEDLSKKLTERGFEVSLRDLPKRYTTEVRIRWR